MPRVRVHPSVCLRGARICVRAVVLLCIYMPGCARVCRRRGRGKGGRWGLSLRLPG